MSLTGFAALTGRSAALASPGEASAATDSATVANIVFPNDMNTPNCRPNHHRPLDWRLAPIVTGEKPQLFTPPAASLIKNMRATRDLEGFRARGAIGAHGKSQANGSRRVVLVEFFGSRPP